MKGLQGIRYRDDRVNYKGHEEWGVEDGILWVDESDCRRVCYPLE